MAGAPGNPQTLCLPYFTLRIIVGILGITLPFILPLGAWIFFGEGLKDSISAYAHTDMRDVFVGIIFIIGSFLITYKGYDIIDNIVSTIGGISAILAAIFDSQGVSGTLHKIFAALFFLALIYFALVLFPKTSPVIPTTPQKLQRNKVYKTCGWIMSICLVLLVIYSFLPNSIEQLLKPFHLGLILESIAVIAFGFCWLTKGGGIWKETPH